MKASKYKIAYHNYMKVMYRVHSPHHELLDCTVQCAEVSENQQLDELYVWAIPFEETGHFSEMQRRY